MAWKVWCVVAVSLVVGYMHSHSLYMCSHSLFNCKYNIKMREKKKIPLGGAQDAFKAPFFSISFPRSCYCYPLGPFFLVP